MKEIIISKQLKDENGLLLYEGETLFDKPYGIGKTYFANGKVFQEGKFGIKGLISGKEYYPSGNIRFEGTYEINKGYGPNYPIEGKCYDDAGQLYYEGKIQCKFGGVGYPTISIPEEFGPVVQSNRPDIKYFMWEDDEKRRNS